MANSFALRFDRRVRKLSACDFPGKVTGCSGLESTDIRPAGSRASTPASTPGSQGITGRGPRRRLLLTGFEPFGGDTVNPLKELALALDGRTIGGWEITGVVLPVTYGVAAGQVLRLVWGCDSPEALAELGGHTDPGAEPSGAGKTRPTGPSYDVILSLGQAKGRAKVCLERIAINIRDASLPDHAGNVACDEPIVPGGPAAYFSNLPLRAMLSAIEAAGVPAAISNTAGTYVCNDLFYLSLHFAATAFSRTAHEGGAAHSGFRPGVPVGVGFIHLPALPEQVGQGAGVAPGDGRRAGAPEPVIPSLSLAQMLKAVAAAIEAIGDMGWRY